MSTMQPLISVDHESRHNSYRADDVNVQSPTEETPLLHRFPQNNIYQRSRSTTIAVSLLILLLLLGVIIGIYLLILQNDSENVVPPIETPLLLVSRAQWDRVAPSHSVSSLKQFKANEVIVVQSNTRQCFNTQSCTRLLQEMQTKFTAKRPLPYNFLISSNGQTYEVLGWHEPSPMFPEYSSSALVLGFIGDFAVKEPRYTQIEEAKHFLAVSVSRHYLKASYILIGKYTNETSSKLFRRLMKLPQWSTELSD